MEVLIGLVVGGAGFIGSHVVDKLVEDGHLITVFDNLSFGRMQNINSKVEFITGDIRHLNQLTQAFESDTYDFVINFAAQVSTFRAIDEPMLDFDINARGIMNLLVSMKSYNPKATLIYTSSRSVYGPVMKGKANESTIPNPINSLYPVHKLYGENLSKTFKHNYNIDTVIVRPSNVVGPRQPNAGNSYNFVSYWCSKLLRNNPMPIFGDGKQIRDYNDVRDVAEAYRLVVNNIDVTKNETFLVSSGKGYTLIEIANKLAAISGKKYASIQWFKKRRGDIERFIGDSKKIKRVLGWVPQYSIDQTLLDTYNYVAQNLSYYSSD